MVFPSDHPEFPDKPTGIKFVLAKHSLYQSCLHGKHESFCKADAVACCNKWIFEFQPDFQEQKSLAHKTINDASHLCTFLPKFYCELNFSKFFWGKVKRYLHGNCNGTFETLKANPPLVMQSVQLSTIWLWEYCMSWWMEAYQSGLETKDA
ncbi:hypothetical protein M404DRAFT_151096 [Pisolithus tinctorius Marx 270]|uniref:Uncharacterized protein n=1 Tax=Pisolithus tinctorius Marx 270 TaxID=870435 RepID=A0A0C3P0I1_PISTI|nr:hypothetical protein M404DRAFT_151096 [Pisolithus tinctorius Marx 270]